MHTSQSSHYAATVNSAVVVVRLLDNFLECDWFAIDT